MRGATREERSLPPTHTHSADAYASARLRLIQWTAASRHSIRNHWNSTDCYSWNPQILLNVFGSCRTSRRLSYQRTADTSTPLAFREVLSSSLALGPRQL
uniref:Uncharacterized protein n=1 Tax=Caenorhabditis japonica TaxID=281687 RepID=A0A8R1I939_CAEJA